MKRPTSVVKVMMGVIVFCFLLGSLDKGMGEGANATLGKIGSSKGRYVKKDHKAWLSKGRIVGIAQKAPDFKVTVMTSSKREVKTVEAERLKKGNKTYEVWLEPGTYIMLVSAKGYEPLDLKGLVVKAGNDLRIDLEFGR